MAEPGALAYPVVLMSMYGVARVGRAQRWEALEWLRMGALATLFGMVIAVQVKLVALGLAARPIAMLSLVLSFAGMTVLLGLYLHERWREWARPLPKLTAVLRA